MLFRVTIGVYSKADHILVETWVVVQQAVNGACDFALTATNWHAACYELICCGMVLCRCFIAGGYRCGGPCCGGVFAWFAGRCHLAGFGCSPSRRLMRVVHMWFVPVSVMLMRMLFCSCACGGGLVGGSPGFTLKHNFKTKQQAGA